MGVYCNGKSRRSRRNSGKNGAVSKALINLFSRIERKVNQNHSKAGYNSNRTEALAHCCRIRWCCRKLRVFSNSSFALSSRISRLRSSNFSFSVLPRYPGEMMCREACAGCNHHFFRRGVVLAEVSAGIFMVVSTTPE